MRKKDCHKNEDRFKEFLAEAEEILNAMAKDLLKFSKGVKAGIIDPAILNNIFRAAHTLKGISEIFEVKGITELSHALEDKLDQLRLGRISFTLDLFGAIMDAHELLEKIVMSRGKKDFSGEVASIKKVLAGSFEKKRGGGRWQIDKEVMSALTEFEEHRLRENLKQGKNIFLVNVSFPAATFDKGYMSLTETLDRDAELIATLPSSGTDSDMLSFIVLAGTYKEKDYILHVLKDFSGVRITLPGRSETPGGEGQKCAEETTGPGEGAPAATLIESLRRTKRSVRVNIEKIDHIMHVVSELGMLHSSLKKLVGEVKVKRGLSKYSREFSGIETELDRKFAQLRESVFDIRRVPIGRLFSRFDTFIERVAVATGKDIRIVTHGGNTEIDKFIIEELADPLMHIIRNVIDHGIEPMETRLKLGKKREGTVTFNAYRKGENVVVEVRDDGAGIDEEAVCRKAIEKGLLSEETSKGLIRQEKLDMLFVPGFTMTDEVSITSGRGVGLDVVKENITRLGGTIEIDTVKGKGTRFISTIPVTQDVVKAVIVEDSKERYAMPLGSVLKIVDLDSPKARVDDFIVLDERKIPAVRLSEFFGVKAKPNGNAYYGIVAGLTSKCFCIIVSELVEELDVMIKPLPDMIKVPGIAGAAETDDNGTVLVLDAEGMLERLESEGKGFRPAVNIV
ncbi:MAG: chemotaxis protein CheA [Thermodesulfobacteriota bacterium]